MTLSVLILWTLGALLAAGGVALLVIGAFLTSRRLGVRTPVVGQTGCRCPACGYSTDGLEADICPECGGQFAQTAVERERTRRRTLVVAGFALLLGAGLSFPVADAARFGVAHALPNAALIEWLAWNPNSYPALEIELQTRTDSGAMRTWERRRLAGVCSRILGGAADASLRRCAANLLGRLAPDADPRAVVAMLSDRDAGVRAGGVQAISRRGEADAWTRRRLATMACSDRSVQVRKRAVDAMRYLGSSAESRSALTQALEDPNDGVRQRALFAMSEAEPSSAGLRAVAARTEDVDEEVREAAAWALARMAARQRGAIGALMRSMADVSPLVRASAAWHLGTAHHDSALVLPCLLTAALGDEEAEVRVAALAAIRLIQG